MELRDGLLALLAPLTVGESLGGAVLVCASTELGPRLTFEIDGARVHIEVFPSETERAHAARSERLLFAYRAGDLDGERGQALCRAVASRASLNERNVLAQLAEPRGEANGSSTRLRQIRGGPMLELAGTPELPWYSLSPYVGCLIGCRFCYAQDRVGISRRLRTLPDAPWGSYVDGRVDGPDVLAQELREVPPHPIKLCPVVSDPYQAVEAKWKLTRGCLERLSEAPTRPVLILTRARLIERDIDVLESLPDARVGFSVPTLDDAVRTWFEPRGAPIDERLGVLRRMKERGIKTFAVVQPMLPGDPDQLADQLAEVADSVSLDILRGEENAASLFDRHHAARTEAWQRAQLSTLEQALESRGVPRWEGELPPDLAG